MLESQSADRAYTGGLDKQAGAVCVFMRESVMGMCPWPEGVTVIHCPYLGPAWEPSGSGREAWPVTWRKHINVAQSLKDAQTERKRLVCKT